MKKLILTAVVVFVVPAVSAAGPQPPPPPGLVSVEGAGTFWSYTGRDYSGSRTDPINLVFLGDADPRLIRQTLLALDGNRTAHPLLKGFDCTWRDAIGRPQTGYSEEAGWQGSAVQLECGDYATLRAHLRLLRHGEYTLGGAHLEIQIPGTSEHEVLSWIIPRELVAFDLLRSGSVMDAEYAGGLTQVPSYRAIRYQVLNGIPDPIRAALGLPTGEVTTDYPIPNDGLAWVQTLWGQLEPTQSEVVVEFDHLFDQFIPKPFCAGGGEVVYVNGFIHMVHRVHTNPSGKYGSRFEATGTLQVVPIAPPGPPVLATISEVFRSQITDRNQTASTKTEQVLLSDPEQWLIEKLWAGNRKAYVHEESCGY